MPGDSLRPDGHRLILPRRPEALTLPPLPPRRFDEDELAQSSDDSRVSYSSNDSQVRPERWDGFDEDAPRPLDTTPLPDVRLLWPLMADLAPAQVEPAEPVATVPCPGCGAELTEAVKSWCLRCGYESQMNLRQMAPAEGGVRQAVVVLLFAAAGCLAIIAATAFRRDIVPDRTDLRMWWIGYQGAGGFLLYWIGHAIAVGLTMKHWPDPQPSFFDPLAVWRYALYCLPKTRWAITYGVWGATAFGCAFVLFCLNDFSIKDKTAKQKIRRSEIVTTEQEAGSGGSTSPTAAPAGHGREPEGRPSGTEEDGPVADAPRLRPHSLRGAAVVIGYVPHPTDPDRVAQVMLGVRSAGGGIRFAGVARLDTSVKDSEALGRLRALGRPAATPGYHLTRDVIPVEPKLLADIRYAELDSRGIFKDTVITAVAEAGGR